MPLSKIFPCFQFRLVDNIYTLDYSNNVLSDCFPHVWQYERTLEELNITSARVNYLPPQLFYCQGLKVLLASNNNIENIPEAIGALRLLQKLNINRNFITNVPDNIKSCKNLTHLDLSCNTLQKLPDAITCLISLQELLLNETYLEFLPANFGRLINLQILELRSNNLVSLPKSMHRLSNLIRLDIGCNEFKVLPEVIGELKQLRELWFDFNQIKHLPPFLGQLRDLVHCEANGNCFKNIPNELCDWRNLQLLSISINSLNNLFYDIGSLKSLVTLKCENNLLSDLPDSISMLENLEELDVRHNILVSLPNTVGMLRKLRYLFADDNKLLNIPNEICSCSALSILSISRNQISELPNNLGHLYNLKVLNIVENKISSLPVTVLSLVNLKSLWINNNQSQPLISLQYADISKKSELTCFMLPQSTTEYQSSHATHTNDKYRQFTPKHTDSDEQSANILMKRRICFAEEATILSSSNPSLMKISSPNTNTNNTHPLHSFNEANYCKRQDRQVELIPVPPSKDLLMRSPTPYPKELRLMAKFIQGNQNLNSDSRYENNGGTKSKNCDTQTETTYFNYNNEKSNNIKQNVRLEINESNLQGFPEIPQNFNDYKKDGKVHNSKFICNQVPVTPLDFSRTKNYSYETKYEKISNENSAKEISPNKRKILCAEIQCLNPNAVLRNDTKKSNNKWLFGVHKNPRVLQVQVIWENGCDITVDLLPNKEGIYVVSTVPKSSASKILFPFDKLLEVDGTDFTCISLIEARQVLHKPRSIINIMLSR